MSAGSDYLPIADYGVIGNLRSIALVGLNGSIDWCCFPHLDDPSVFAALLDHRRGGRFKISPATGWKSEQQYWLHTNVLQTTFQCSGGELEVVDWMPLRGDINGCGKSQTAAAIYRRLACRGGPIEVELEWSPRFDYARQRPEIARTADGFIAAAGSGQQLTLSALPGVTIVDGAFGPAVRGRFSLEPTVPLVLATRWDSDTPAVDPGAARESLRETAETWRRWVEKPQAQEVRQWAAVDAELMIRSELVLRLLAHGETGGIAGAATTSLPEVIGGIRNWDYRYVWLRDSSQIVESFLALGHRAEAVELLNFVERISRHRQGNGDSLQIMYGLHGQRDVPEETLDHLEGYRGSRPVRIGNGGFQQIQHDVFGELLDSAYELARFGEPLSAKMWAFLREVVDQACEQWRKPDYGIWEIPGQRQHYVYTKCMIWVALDRGILLAERFQLEGDVQRWRAERDRVHAEILRCGYSSEHNAFTMVYGGDELDAANLIMPVREFLPPDDPRMQATIDRTIQRLTTDSLVYRYRTDDGLEGEEGTFGLMSFWLVDALAYSGRLQEARAYLKAMIGKANHLGLFAEQVDPRSGQLLGNFPQMFTHTGLLESALHLAYFERRDKRIPPPIGSPEHRRKVRR